MGNWANTVSDFLEYLRSSQIAWNGSIIFDLFFNNLNTIIPKPGSKRDRAQHNTTNKRLVIHI